MTRVQDAILKTGILTLFMLGQTFFAAADPVALQPTLHIDLNHTNAIYACGETAVFQIT